MSPVFGIPRLLLAAALAVVAYLNMTSTHADPGDIVIASVEVVALFSLFSPLRILADMAVALIVGFGALVTPRGEGCGCFGDVAIPYHYHLGISAALLALVMVDVLLLPRPLSSPRGDHEFVAASR